MTDTTGYEPMLTLPANSLGALHRALAQGRSPVEAAQAARQLGFESGAGFYNSLRSWAGRDGEDLTVVASETFWRRLSEFFAHQGWGSLEFEQLHPGVAALSSTEWVEAHVEENSSQPTCHITTGMLSDLLGRVIDQDIAVMEVECRSRGDARCRFLVGGPETLDRLYEELRAGQPYSEALQRLG